MKSMSSRQAIVNHMPRRIILELLFILKFFSSTNRGRVCSAFSPPSACCDQRNPVNSIDHREPSRSIMVALFTFPHLFLLVLTLLPDGSHEFNPRK